MNMLFILIISILLIAMFYFIFIKTTSEGFYNPSGKYILLPITTQKEDIYNYPIKVDMSSSEKIRDSIYNHNIENIDKEYSISQLLNNYYSVISNRLLSIEDTEGNFTKTDIIDSIYIINSNKIDSKLNDGKIFSYRKSFNGSTFEIDNITKLNKCKSNPIINNCGYANGRYEITDYIVLKISDNVLPTQLNTYLKYISKYVNNNNITYKTDDDFINIESSLLPFNLELTNDNMGSNFVNDLQQIPPELYSLHQYYLMFIKVNKGILNKYPTTNGNIETRYNPLGYININYKHLMNKLYDTFKAPVSVKNRNNFNMLSNRIYDISIASKEMLNKIHANFNSMTNSDNHRYHQFEISGVTNCDYNLLYDNDSYTLSKLNIGNTSSLNLQNVRNALPKCGDANVLFTDAPTDIETAEEMVDISGNQFINIPLIFKIDSEVNPTDLYNAANSLQSRGDIKIAPINLFIKISDNILTITPQSYLLKLNNINDINTEFDKLNDKAIINFHEDYIAIEDSEFDSTEYPDFSTRPTTSSTRPTTSSTRPTTSSTQPTTSSTRPTTSSTRPTTSSTRPTTSSTQPTTSSTRPTTSTTQPMIRQQTEGVLLDINGNPLSYGLAPNSSPGINSSHQGEIISSPGFYTEQPNTIKNRVIGNIDDLTVAELHSHMHKLDPYFNEYSVPSNDVSSKGNIYVKDYKGNLNIFYPNIISY
jgi:hypothetical protein